MSERLDAARRKRSEDFLLVVDPLPLRLRGLAATELPVTAAAAADWDISISGGLMLEARRYCRRVEVERLLAAHPELAIYANVYLEEGIPDTGRHRHQELFWAEDESRLVMA